MVDPSLLRQAADRGVTIAFADLDGADGLWVPEERTVLVNRGLSAAAVAEVIEHELAHVAIDDQHADLDAGREVLVGRPPARRTGALSALLAAAAFVAVVGGVLFGLSRAGGPGREQVVGPVPSGLTASERGEVPQPRTTVVTVRDAQGRLVTRTIVMTASPTLPTTSAGSLAPTASAPVTAARTSAPTPPRGPASATRTATPTPNPTAAEPSATTPAPTTPAPTTAVPTGTGVGEPGDGGGAPGGGAVGGGPGTDGGSGIALGTEPALPSAGGTGEIGTVSPTVSAS